MKRLFCFLSILLISGSGFVVRPTGEIVTNYHVIEGARSAIVKFPTMEEKFTVGEIVHLDPVHDLAVIRINFKANPLYVGYDERVQVADKIMVVGNPGGFSAKVSTGIIGGLWKMKNGSRMMHITAPVSPGSSGGPVINEQGELIGVASSGLLGKWNLNLAIPASTLKRLMMQRRLGIPFGTQEIPERKQRAELQGKMETSPINIVNFASYSNKVAFSIQNKTRHDIRKVEFLVVWYHKGKKVHHNAIPIKDRIPASQTKKIESTASGVAIGSDGSGNLQYSYDVRILDYEILPTSKVLEFDK